MLEPSFSQSRREFLQVGMPVASLMLAGPIGRSEKPKEDPWAGAIDAHAHVWTSDVARYPLAPGYAKERMASASFTPEELLAQAGPCGVRRVVLIQVSYYGHDNS